MSENSCDQSGAFNRFLNFLLRLLGMRKSPSVKVKAVTADSSMNLHVIHTDYNRMCFIKTVRGGNKLFVRRFWLIHLNFQCGEQKKKKSAGEWWQKSQVEENSLNTNVE